MSGEDDKTRKVSFKMKKMIIAVLAMLVGSVFAERNFWRDYVAEDGWGWKDSAIYVADKKIKYNKILRHDNSDTYVYLFEYEIFPKKAKWIVYDHGAFSGYDGLYDYLKNNGYVRAIVQRSRNGEQSYRHYMLSGRFLFMTEDDIEDIIKWLRVK